VRPTAPTWIDLGHLSAGDEVSPPLPLVPVVVQAGPLRLQSYGLVDSGSSASYLSPQLAEGLGLSPRPRPKSSSTMAGPMRVGTVHADLAVRTPGGELSFPRVEFLVPRRRQQVPLVVLGHEPFFNEVEIRFQNWRSRFGITRRTPAW
jgi:hypothetical protein